MKEYFKNGRRVIEYDYRDWKAGRCLAFSGLIESHILKEVYYQLIPEKQFNFIRRRQQKLYWTKVYCAFVSHVRDFERREKKSDNKPEFKEQRIQQIENELYRSRLKKVYDKIIVQGIRDYSKTCVKDWTRPSDTDFIRVESLFKFLQWLRPDLSRKQSNTVRKSNGRAGGVAKGESTFQQLKSFCLIKGIGVENLQGTNTSIATFLTRLGHSIDKNTVNNHKLRLIAELKRVK